MESNKSLSKIHSGEITCESHWDFVAGNYIEFLCFELEIGIQQATSIGVHLSPSVKSSEFPHCKIRRSPIGNQEYVIRLYANMNEPREKQHTY